MLALERALDLPQAIEQFEAGEVDMQRTREVGGVNWDSHKNTDSRRRKLISILRDDFGGDKAKFYAFFMLRPGQIAEKQKKHPNRPENLYMSCNRLADKLFPACKRALRAERAKPEYNPNGEFSQELWVMQWGGKNDWEIFKELDSAVSEAVGRSDSEEGGELEGDTEGA